MAVVDWAAVCLETRACLLSSRKTSGGRGTLAMISVPVGIMFAAIWRSRTLSNWQDGNEHAAGSIVHRHE
jgi:hypothetical protein